MGVLSPFLIIFIVASVIAGWPKFYRWAFFPKRDPDFEHRLYVYWFDEKVAYSKLANKKKKRFYEIDNVLCESYHYNVANKDKKFSTGILPKEVQVAYRDHVNKKFEEIVLGV